jgi:hypothetical protein
MAETLDDLREQYPDRLTLNDDGSVLWRLCDPLLTEGGVIEAVPLRRPMARDLKAGNAGSDAERTSAILARLSGLSAEVLDEADGEDTTALGRIFSAFMGVSGLDIADQYPDRFALNDDGSASWILIRPLPVAGKMLETIRMARPKGRQIKRIKGRSDVDKTLWIVAELTGIAPPHLDGLDGEDFSALGRIFARFLGLSRPTGGA